MTLIPEAVLLAGALFALGPSANATLKNARPEEALTEAIGRNDSVAALRWARALAAPESPRDDDRIGLATRLEDLAKRVRELPGPEVAAFVEEQLLRSLALREQVDGRDRLEHLETLEQLSEAYFGAGRWERAEEIDRRCLAIKTAARGPRDPSVAETQRNLSLSLVNQGKLRAAEELLREAVATLDGLPGARPLQVAYAISDLADNLRAQSRYREATPLFERSVSLAEQALGPGNPELVTLLINLEGSIAIPTDTASRPGAWGRPSRSPRPPRK